jgi:CBS-domain-containing membrane protein
MTGWVITYIVLVATGFVYSAIHDHVVPRHRQEKPPMETHDTKNVHHKSSGGG